MLRARGDRWEYLAIEVALRRAAPPPLTPEQRERIRARIMAQLGAQEPARPPLVFRTRWVAVPVGAGLAATIVAGVRLVAHRFSGDEGGAGVVVGGRLLTGGRTVDELGTGQVAVARTDTTVLFPEAGARFDAVAGSRFELLADSGELVFRLETGRFSVASEATPVRLQGQGWSAVFATGGVGSANVASDRARFTVYEGALTVSVGGAICTAGAGDTVIVPAGTLHAIGRGILLYEIQEQSDITYRFYDWDRVDTAGRGRPLHIEDGLAVLRPERQARRTQPLALDEWRTVLTACRYFLLERWEISGARVVEFAPGQTFRLLSCIAGELALRVPPRSTIRMGVGQTTLLPATVTHLALDGQGTLLAASVPDLVGDVVAPLRTRTHDIAAIRQLAGSTGDLDSFLQQPADS